MSKNLKPNDRFVLFFLYTKMVQEKKSKGRAPGKGLGGVGCGRGCGDVGTGGRLAWTEA